MIPQGHVLHEVFGRSCYFLDFLPLPRHCDKGKQDGDDGLLVHVYFNLFVIVEYFLELRFQFIYAVGYGDDGAVAVNEE